MAQCAINTLFDTLVAAWCNECMRCSGHDIVMMLDPTPEEAHALCAHMELNENLFSYQFSLHWTHQECQEQAVDLFHAAFARFVRLRLRDSGQNLVFLRQLSFEPCHNCMHIIVQYEHRRYRSSHPSARVTPATRIIYESHDDGLHELVRVSDASQ
jgi:hypothetical protein